MEKKKNVFEKRQMCCWKWAIFRYWIEMHGKVCSRRQSNNALRTGTSSGLNHEQIENCVKKIVIRSSGSLICRFWYSFYYYCAFSTMPSARRMCFGVGIWLRLILSNTIHVTPIAFTLRNQFLIVTSNQAKNNNVFPKNISLWVVREIRYSVRHRK